MCTVSTSLNDTAFIVTMNRDERRTRLEGPLHRDNTHCYPTDQVGGGTWCGINQHGLIFCLLNRYDAPVSVDDSIVSRGGIIPTLLACTEISEVRSRIRLLNLVQYNGFRLLVLSASACDQHDWDRAEYSVTPLEKPGEVFASSSSVNSLEFPKRREERYLQWRQDESGPKTPGHIPSIHLHEPSVTPNESIFMVRESTHTKSICQLVVQDENVSLNYWPAQLGFNRGDAQYWSAARDVSGLN